MQVLVVGELGEIVAQLRELNILVATPCSSSRLYLEGKLASCCGQRYAVKGY